MRLGVSVLVFENGEARIGLAIFEHVMDYVNIGKRIDICISFGTGFTEMPRHAEFELLEPDIHEIIYDFPNSNSQLHSRLYLRKNIYC